MDPSVLREVRMRKGSSLSVEIVITVLLISDASMRFRSRALREKHYFSEEKGYFSENMKVSAVK